MAAIPDGPSRNTADTARRLAGVVPGPEEPEGDEPVVLVTGGMAYAAEAAAYAARLPGEGLDGYHDLALDADLGPYETETYAPQLGPL
jgi:hypothetical protein